MGTSGHCVACGMELHRGQHYEEQPDGTVTPVEPAALAGAQNAAPGIEGTQEQPGLARSGPPSSSGRPAPDAAPDMPEEPMGEFERMTLYREQKENAGLPPYPKVNYAEWKSEPRFPGDRLIYTGCGLVVSQSDYDALRALNGG